MASLRTNALAFGGLMTSKAGEVAIPAADLILR